MLFNPCLQSSLPFFVLQIRGAFLLTKLLNIYYIKFLKKNSFKSFLYRFLYHFYLMDGGKGFNDE